MDMGTRLLFVLLLSCSLPAAALDKVVLQLKWTHAFQFAGYYAALDQGYYRDAGLEVAIREAGVTTHPVDEVLSGRAQYAVGTSSLLLERAAGKPVVALAVVFQQSPYEIYALPNIHTLRDLEGKRLMVEPQADELFAYLKKEGVDLARVKLLTHSLDAEGLMRGDADAIAGYVSNEPYDFERAQFLYRTFSPRSAGIDFYGDNLFTSARELQDHPERVRAFREASMRGWQYAKAHPQAVIDLILSKYSSKVSREYLQFESHRMVPLLQPNLIAIGYMNPDRWRFIADTYSELGLMPYGFPLDGFLYDASEPDLSWLYRILAVSLLSLALGSMVGLYILHINRRLRASQEELRESESHYRLLVENMRDVVWVLDPYTLRFHYTSPSVERARGFSVEEMMDMPLDQTVVSEAAAPLKRKIDTYLAEYLSGGYPNKVYTEELPLLCKDGTTVWGEVIARFVRNETTGQVELHGVSRDITERRAAQVRIEHMALHDLLTGLPNRALLNDRLQQALTASKRDQSHGAVMFIDLDRFKPVNDEMGHDVGDLLLLEASVRMQGCLRSSDTVARVGGDEFIVLLRPIQDVSDATMVAERLRKSLRAPFHLAGRELSISCSIGIALYPQHDDIASELYKKADIAMYCAKKSGRDSACLYQDRAESGV
jgi:diguanylate cyclase (GGDEF)-like protein/PAS domain S-box-containing protein